MNTQTPASTTRELRICLIGGGPRGTSTLERICANAGLLGTDRRAVVHVVDPFPSGGGGVWRTSQPVQLLMNTVSSQVSAFTDASVDCAGPIVDGPSLDEWARQLAAGQFGTGHSAEVRAEAAALGPDDYPSRSFYGHYLNWVFQRLLRTAPDQLRIEVHRSTAVALDTDVDESQAVTLQDGTRLAALDAVVLALGHGPAQHESLWEHEREQRKLFYVASTNPADADLSWVRPGMPVALRGLGLCFFDYLALLTVGRGGTFVTGPDGLVYQPSGQEPVMYAGSRRGVPYHSRGENQKGPTGRHEPRFLTGEVIAELRRCADTGQPVSFGRDIWPLIDREVRGVYYHALLDATVGADTAGRFMSSYVGCPADGVADLLDRYGIAAPQRWSWDRIKKPYNDEDCGSAEVFRSWLLGYLRRDVAEARMGNVSGPLKAALDVLRDLRNEIRLAVDHGGIAGGSYRDELEGWYNPLNAFTSIGPPARRIEEMIALIEAGVLHPVGPGIRARPFVSNEGFMVDSVSVPGPTVPVRGLIEARLPDPGLRRSVNPLLRYLLGTGQCQLYRLPDPGRDEYVTGGLAVTTRPYRVLDRTGRPHPRRFAFGVPTEAVHWVTAAGIRPGVGSVTLADADAVARAALSLPPTRTGTSTDVLAAG